MCLKTTCFWCPSLKTGFAVNHVEKVFFGIAFGTTTDNNNKTLNVIQTTITEVHYQDIKGN